MLLVLFRHGPAVDRADPDCPPDPDRPLTIDGTRRTRRAAAGLARLGVRADRLLTSPYVRAVQTAEIAADALAFAGDLEIVDALLPGADPRELVGRAALETGTLVVTGHEPHLSSVAATALGAPFAPIVLKKAGALLLDLDRDQEPVGVLRGLYAPKALRALAGDDR